MSAPVRVRWMPLVIALAVGAPLISGVTVLTQSKTEKTVFLAVVDEAGKPVTDLAKDEILVREDGTDREVIDVKAATQPLYIELLADTTPAATDYIRDIRTAFMAFVKQVHAVNPDANIALMEFGQAAITMTPFTADPVQLEKGINKLAGKPGGSVLLEALVEASNDLAKKAGARRAIVALNMEPSDEQSREDPKKIADALKKSGAQLWSISLQKGALRNPARDIVLGPLTKATGGNREFIVGQSAIESLLKSYADALTAQYAVTYKRPESSKAAQIVQIGLTRGGSLKLHASAFAPQ